MARFPIPSALASSSRPEIEASRAPHANCDGQHNLYVPFYFSCCQSDTNRALRKQTTYKRLVHKNIELMSFTIQGARAYVMQCRTVLAHVWTMRSLLYRAAQNDAGPRLGPPHLTVPHPVLYCSAGDVILHKLDLLHPTHDCWQGFLWTLPAATTKQRNT